MTAVVTLNGQELARHEGGYATFRVNLTPALAAQNTLTVAVDNGKNRTVYPQKADFTFYGGIYRPVHLLVVPKAHFALDYHGAPGLRITPVLSADLKTAEIHAEAWVIRHRTERAVHAGRRDAFRACHGRQGGMHVQARKRPPVGWRQ